MRLLTLKWVVALGAVAYFASPAVAQQSGAGTRSPDAQVDFSKKTQLTPQEQLEEASRRLTRMQNQSAAIAKKLQTARQSRDVVKSLCLNDKLSQVNTASRTAADRAAALKSSVARNDAEAANHEYSVLAVLAQRSEQLGSEASQCVGEESAFVGDTAVKTTIDPTVAPDDATYPGFPVTPNPLPPPCLSCQR